MGYYHFGFGGLFMWVFWVFLFWIIFGFVRGGCWNGSCHGRSFGHKDDTDQAMAILKERFAKGEISKEEFEEKRRALLG